MDPVIAIVGRPNVGKSTLFNAWMGERISIVADVEGVTRDRIYGQTDLQGRRCWLIDTGGIDIAAPASSLQALLREQVEVALLEAQVIVWVLDARAGILPQDRILAERLRVQSKPVVVALNKTDGCPVEWIIGDFYALGFPEVRTIAAQSRRGLQGLARAVLAHVPQPAAIGLEEVLDAPIPEAPLLEDPCAEDAVHADQPGPGVQVPPIRVAVLGRPNVGKSTLINQMIGEDRLMVFDAPGTTRDAVAVPFTHLGVPYVLVDTAGVRRKRAVHDGVERYSVIRTFASMEQSQVVVVVLDATLGITDQDLALLRLVEHAGKAWVLGVNKWDRLGRHARMAYRQDLRTRIDFAPDALIQYFSALDGRGVGGVYKAIQRAHRAAFKALPTPVLSKLLAEAVLQHAPTRVGGRRIRLRYAHCGGHNPPIIVIHGNQTEGLAASYVRYLEGFFRKALRLEGTPIQLVFKTGTNPYVTER